MKTFEEILFENFNYLDENELLEEFENHINNEYSFFDFDEPFTSLNPVEVLEVMLPDDYEKMKEEYFKENFVFFSSNEYFRSDEYDKSLEMFEEEKIDNSVWEH